MAEPRRAAAAVLLLLLAALTATTAAAPRPSAALVVNCTAASLTYVKPAAVLPPPGNATFFGQRLALSADGRRLAVAARNDNRCFSGGSGGGGVGCPNSGAVHVFERDSLAGTGGGGWGPWRQVADLKAANAGATDYFGHSLSLHPSGDSLAVGAFEEASCVAGNPLNDTCRGAGAVYVFEREAGSGVWQQTAYLKPENPVTGARFGVDVSLDGVRLAVGSSLDPSCAAGVSTSWPSPADSACASAGSVFVFRSGVSGWQFEAYIKPAVVNGGNQFGSAVALDGLRLAVGAPLEASCFANMPTNTGCSGAGAAYVFEFSLGWTQSAYLKASTQPAAADQFGTDLSLSGDLLAVGAPNEKWCGRGIDPSYGGDTCLGSGAAFVFVKPAGSPVWRTDAYIKPSNTNQYFTFGNSLELRGSQLVVGAPGDSSCDVACRNFNSSTDLSCPSAGAIYAFDRQDVIPTSGTWEQTNYIKAPNAEASDRLGSVTLSATDGVIAMGAPGEQSCSPGINGDDSDNNCPQAGAAYIIEPQALVESPPPGTTGAPLTTTAVASTTGSSSTTLAPLTTAVSGGPAPTAATTGSDGNVGDGGGGDGDPAESSPFFAGLGLILAIVLAAVVCLLCLVCIGAVLYRRRRRAEEEENDSSNSNTYCQSAAATPSPPGGTTPLGKERTSAIEATSYTNLLRGVEIDCQIGEGNFGKVFKATRRGEVVAVKQVQGGAAEDEFMKELDVMLGLDSERVIKLHGVCMLADHGGGLGLVMEFAALGALNAHLKKAGGRLGTSALVQISLHIAEGLAYLHSVNIVHRDLAARNVLVTADGSCKLADFGLARIVAEGETYVAHSALPVRWTAPEVLLDSTVTQAADSYSLAMTMIEVFTQGKSPFAEHKTNVAVAEAVCSGGRPSRPKACPEGIFALIEALWAQEPGDRTTAAKVVPQLRKQFDEIANDDSDDSDGGEVEYVYASVLLALSDEHYQS